MVSIPWSAVAPREKQYRLDPKCQYYGITDFKLVNKTTEQFEKLDAIYSQRKKLILEGTLIHPIDKTKNIKHLMVEQLDCYSYDHGTGPEFYGIWIQTTDENWFLLKEPAKEYYNTFAEDYKKGWIFISFVLVAHQQPDTEESIQHFWDALQEKKINPEDVVPHYSYLVEKLQDLNSHGYRSFLLFKLLKWFIEEHTSKKRTRSSSPTLEVVESEEEEQQDEVEEEPPYCTYCEERVNENSCMMTLECLNCNNVICYKCCKKEKYHFDFLWSKGWQCYECMKEEHEDLDEKKYKLKNNPTQYDIIYRASIPDVKTLIRSSSPEQQQSPIKQRKTTQLLDDIDLSHIHLPPPTQKVRKTRTRTKKQNAASSSIEDPTVVAKYREKQLNHLQQALISAPLLKDGTTLAQDIENKVFEVNSTNYLAYVDRIRNIIQLLKKQEIQEKIYKQEYTINDLATKDVTELKTEKLLDTIQPLQAEKIGYESTVYKCKMCNSQRTLVTQIDANRKNISCINCNYTWIEM